MEPHGFTAVVPIFTRLRSFRATVDPPKHEVRRWTARRRIKTKAWPYRGYLFRASIVVVVDAVLPVLSWTVSATVNSLGSNDPL